MFYKPVKCRADRLTHKRGSLPNCAHVTCETDFISIQISKAVHPKACISPPTLRWYELRSHTKGRTHASILKIPSFDLSRV
jgi:hypothetical protein